MSQKAILGYHMLSHIVTYLTDNECDNRGLTKMAMFVTDIVTHPANAMPLNYPISDMGTIIMSR